MVRYKNKCEILLVFFSLILCASFVSKAQTKSGTIVYGVKLNEEAFGNLESETRKSETNNYYGNIMNRLKKGFPALNLTMTFNKTRASFEAEKSMGNDNGIDLNLVALTSNTYGLFFTDLSKMEMIRQKKSPSLNKTYRIKSRIGNFNWKISNKTKTINGYKCYKATSLQHRFSRDYKTIAWFCPNIPFQFGPIGFSGLPGMILEMNYHKYYDFFVKDIQFSDHPQKIQKPSKGKIISKKKYQSLIDKRRKAVKKRDSIRFSNQ